MHLNSFTALHPAGPLAGANVNPLVGAFSFSPRGLSWPDPFGRAPPFRPPAPLPPLPNDAAARIADLVFGGGRGGGAAGGSGTVTSITLTQPAAGLTITGSGVAITTTGTPTFALANDLAALEALSSTGLAARTATDTWAQRTITGTASRITVTDGSGAAANPTIDVSTSYAGQATIVTVGTITTGTWTGTVVDVAHGGTGRAAHQAYAPICGGMTTTGAQGSVASAGTTGQALISQGASALPIYATLAPASTSFAATDRIMGRDTAGAGAGEELTISNVLDWTGTNRGGLPMRGASTWSMLQPGATAHHVLRSAGGAADLVYGPYCDVVILRDEKSSGTAGGGLTAGANTRVLNTESSDAAGICTLASNQFTLAAGTYRIRASAPAVVVGMHQAYLYNATAGTTLIRGTQEYADIPFVTMQTRSVVEGRFTVAASQALEIRHDVQTTRATNGGGMPGSFGTEVYTTVYIERESA